MSGTPQPDSHATTPDTEQSAAAGRGQAFTLEAVFASMLLLSAVLFALQTTAITPLTSSTSSQQIQNQQAALANGFLATAEERGQLKPAVLYWNNTSEMWHDSGVDNVYPAGPPNQFGAQLNQTFLNWGVAVNVNIEYYTQPDSLGERDRETQAMVDMGSASTNAITAKRTIVLYDDDVLRDADGSRTSTHLNQTNGSFYAPDAAPNSPVYNVVTIEVVVWRI